MEGNNLYAANAVTGSVTTGVLMAVSAALNLLHFVGDLSQVLHVIASCATIGAACSTIAVGLLTIKKLKKER
jgi:hypothetical protein